MVFCCAWICFGSKFAIPSCPLAFFFFFLKLAWLVKDLVEPDNYTEEKLMTKFQWFFVPGQSIRKLGWIFIQKDASSCTYLHAIQCNQLPWILFHLMFYFFSKLYDHAVCMFCLLIIRWWELVNTQGTIVYVNIFACYKEADPCRHQIWEIFIYCFHLETNVLSTAISH